MLPPFLHKLILDQAIASIGYSEEELQQFRQQLHTEKTYYGWLQHQGVTSEEFESWLTRELTIRKFQQQLWGKKLSSYFLDRKHQLDRVVCSLIYLKDKGIAQELYFRIVEGEQSFESVAQAYSQKAEIETDASGRVGPIELGKLHPILARLFYGARSGQLWQPIELENWIVIARLEESLPVQLDEFMRQSLLNELLEIWVEEQLEQQFPFR